jgi:hypothetical protein
MSLSASASKELERMVADLIPQGKVGAAVTVVDASGTRIGVAMKHKDTWSASLELNQPWAKVKPTVSFKVKATW